MPYATTRSGRIRYAISGPSEAVERPETLLLIMGLAGSGAMWFRLLPHIARRHRAIVFDNRGTGGSSAARMPLTMTGMAGDALAQVGEQRELTRGVRFVLDVEDGVPAAGALSQVHRRVGAAQQLVPGVGVRRIQGDADARRHADRLVVDDECRLARLLHLPGHGRRCPQSGRATRQDHDAVGEPSRCGGSRRGEHGDDLVVGRGGGVGPAGPGHDPARFPGDLESSHAARRSSASTTAGSMVALRTDEARKRNSTPSSSPSRPTDPEADQRRSGWPPDGSTRVTVAPASASNLAQ